jgi:hypothetical protein
MMIAKGNLILGTITRYRLAVIKPFFSTLASTGYSGDLVVFYSDIDLSTLNWLRRRGVTLVPFESVFPYLQHPLTRHLMRWADNKRIGDLNLMCFRYLLAYCYLKEFEEKYQHVMLTDMRDVIFQKDPFGFPIDEKLCCFLEREGISLGRHNQNARWIELAFDRATLERLSDKPIICAGVTIGPINLMTDYLEKMIDLFVSAPGEGWDAAPVGLDQAVHNYLVYNFMLSECKLYQNDGGPVLTVGIEDHVSLNTSELVVNRRGAVPNIVHQYDRHWQVAKRYHSLWTVWKRDLSVHAPKFHQLLVEARKIFFQR